MRITAAVAAAVLYPVLAVADPPVQERSYPRTNGWTWDADTDNKSTPSCLDKYGHEAGALFVAYLGSLRDISITDQTVKLIATQYVDPVVGKRDTKQPGARYWALPQKLFTGKEKPSIGGSPVTQLVSYQSTKPGLTTLTITFLVLDDNVVKCDEIFWTILEVSNRK
jgi:hypothetical protein